MIEQNTDTQKILIDMYEFLKKNILERWYPLVVDRDFGGYYTNVTYDWKLASEQEKMIVSQARHVWTTSKAANFFNDYFYRAIAEHGFYFLKEIMWDKEFGGFFQVRNREGGCSDVEGWREEKRTYGNAFGVYSLAALYELTKDENVLNLAKKSFHWIEEHSFDNQFKGYFQFLTREGKPFDRYSEYKTVATDEVEVGYKDQNSSIHLLEAYTELYNVWKDEKLKEKLHALLLLIRDTITTPKGYMNLFFQNDWTPLSFRFEDEATRKSNFRLDHVSFGHDYETAFLMLEASYILGLENDIQTLITAKRMVDHAIENGFDKDAGGFYDGGYYFADEDKCTIIHQTKNWWAQAEALNILLLMSKIFPGELKYFETFLKEWEYVEKYLLDFENGDWFEGGLDKQPHFKTGSKSHIWKCTYHTGRAMMNCIRMLAEEDFELTKNNPRFDLLREEQNHFINHWQKLSGQI